VRLAGRGPWPPGVPVLVDDIVSTGHTLLAAAQALQEAGLAAPLCIGVHALFEDGALPRLLAGGVRQVVTCDTIAHPTNAIPVAPALAQAVLALAGQA
jgi:ribose-phosphate pyrophosphokinase